MTEQKTRTQILFDALKKHDGRFEKNEDGKIVFDNKYIFNLEHKRNSGYYRSQLYWMYLDGVTKEYREASGISIGWSRRKKISMNVATKSPQKVVAMINKYDDDKREEIQREKDKQERIGKYESKLRAECRKRGLQTLVSRLSRYGRKTYYIELNSNYYFNHKIEVEINSAGEFIAKNIDLQMNNSIPFDVLFDDLKPAIDTINKYNES